MSDPRALLAALRWDVDQCVMNPFGEMVWLQACINEAGERIGITECCWADEPCARHAMSASAPDRSGK